MIEARGGKAIPFPTLAIEASTPDSQFVIDALQSDWLIFTSTNAVDFALPVLNGKMLGAQRLRVAAVGPATADALTKSAWTVDCMPASQFSSEGLLAEPSMQNVEGMICTIVRGVGGREKLAVTLAGRGASVNYLEVYRRICPETDANPLRVRLNHGHRDVITITSTEALINMLAIVGNPFHEALKASTLIVVSDRIKQTAVDLGFQRVIVSDAPTDEAIVETLTRLLNGEDCGGRD